MKKYITLMFFAVLGYIVGAAAFQTPVAAYVGAISAPMLANMVQMPAFTLNTGLGKVTMKALQEQRAQLGRDLEAIIKTAEDESRELSEDEEGKFDLKRSEITALDKKIDRQKTLDEERSRMAANTGIPLGESEAKELRNSAKKYSFTKALRTASDRNSKLDGLELEFHEEAMAEFQRSGASGGSDPSSVLISQKILESVEMRDMTATGGTGGDQGGLTIQTSVMGYIEALRARSVLLRNGADLTMSKENSLYAPAWEGENDPAAESSPTYTKVTFSPKRLGGFIDVSKQLLLQSSESIENRLRNQINVGQALAIDRGGIQGTGANDQPTGIVFDSAVNVIAIGTNGGPITDAILLALEEALENADGAFGNIAFMTTPKVKKFLKLLKLDDGSGMFAWDRLTNTVNGYASEASNQIPKTLTKGTADGVCHAALLGNFSGSAFAQWGGLEILVDPYTQSINNMTRMVVNQYADFHVLQGGMISVVKDITVA